MIYKMEKMAGAIVVLLFLFGSTGAVSTSAAIAPLPWGNTPSDLPPQPSDTPYFSYTLNLQSGWNLVSVPVADYMPIVCVKAPCFNLMPTKLVANSCGTFNVYLFDSSTGGYTRIASEFAQSSVFRLSLDAGKGYWIKVAKPCQLTFDGSVSMDATRLSTGEGWNLFPGWNAIGAPMFPIAFDRLAQSCGKFRGPYAFDPSGKWKLASGNLQPGVGYFVTVYAPCTLLPNLATNVSPTPSSSSNDYGQVNLCKSTGGQWLLGSSHTNAQCICPQNSKWSQSVGCQAPANANSTLGLTPFSDLLSKPWVYDGTKLCTTAFLGKAREFYALMQYEPLRSTTVANSAIPYLEFKGPYVWETSATVTTLGKQVDGVGGVSYQRVQVCGLFEYNPRGGFGPLGQYTYQMS